jgi:hypothetical protein
MKFRLILSKVGFLLSFFMTNLVPLHVGYFMHRVEEPGVKALICQDKWVFW